MRVSKKDREQSLLHRFCQAMSLVPEDVERTLRSPQGKLHVYPRNESLHQAQLERMKSC